jgi:Flp pilus assembly protein TadG
MIAFTHLRRANKERGQVVLEFLPVALLLMTLTFAVVDFSYFIWQSQVIIGLTREGSNIASRDTTLAGAATAITQDATVMHLNLTKKGKVIITTVQNTGTSAKPNFVVTGQYSTGSLSGTSKVGAYNAQTPQTATIPSAVPGTPPVPQPGATLYITEIYTSFSPITPLGVFVKYTLPTKMYDVAYF